MPYHRLMCWFELGCNYASTGKLAASVPLAPTPCALQMIQRNHDYEAWRVAEGRSYQNGCIDLKAMEAI